MYAYACIFSACLLGPFNVFFSLPLKLYFHLRIMCLRASLMQLDERALTEVMKKLFKNYKKWCKYLDRKSSLW